MPILKDNRQLKEIELKCLEGGKVSVYNSFLAADIEKYMKRTNNGKDLGAIAAVAIVIKEWNLTDEAGKVLPITEENIGKLDIKDLNEIIQNSNIEAGFLAARGGAVPTSGKN